MSSKQNLKSLTLSRIWCQKRNFLLEKINFKVFKVFFRITKNFIITDIDFFVEESHALSKLSVIITFYWSWDRPSGTEMNYELFNHNNFNIRYWSCCNSSSNIKDSKIEASQCLPQFCKNVWFLLEVGEGLGWCTKELEDFKIVNYK